jgi:hypothetical protein
MDRTCVVRTIDNLLRHLHKFQLAIDLLSHFRRFHPVNLATPHAYLAVCIATRTLLIEIDDVVSVIAPISTAPIPINCDSGRASSTQVSLNMAFVVPYGHIFKSDPHA